MPSSNEHQRPSGDDRARAVAAHPTNSSPKKNNGLVRGVVSGPDGAAAAILRERARTYAQTEVQVAEAERTQVLLFRVRDEKYAADLRPLRGVVRGDGLSPVPCTPPYVAGVLNVRGAIVTVLDLAVILGLEGTSGPSASCQVILVDNPDGLVGLQVDDVHGAYDVAVDSLDRSLTGRDSVLGVADAEIVVLDLPRLLADDRFKASDNELHIGV